MPNEAPIPSVGFPTFDSVLFDLDTVGVTTVGFMVFATDVLYGMTVTLKSSIISTLKYGPIEGPLVFTFLALPGKQEKM